jgi:ankyrin repeat protein
MSFSLDMIHCTLYKHYQPIQTFFQLLGLMLSKPNDDSDRVKIACLLLNNGAIVDLQDKNGKTPLQVCRSPRVKSGVEDFIRQR